MTTDPTRPQIRRFRPGQTYRWEDVDVLEYKNEGSHFRDITRQVLFEGADGLPSEWRYFEIAPEGHSTLERHEHVHAVLILRGSGHVLLEDGMHRIGALDAVYVPPQTWHQFIAATNEPLGFLCLVACDRDRPHRPTAEEQFQLKSNSAISDHIRI